MPSGQSHCADTDKEMQTAIAVATGPGAVVVPENKYGAPPPPALPPPATPPDAPDADKESGEGQDTWLVPLRATVICGLYCLIGGLVYGLEQDLSAVDAVYFCIVTMSTVGYGDISPDTDGLRAFTVFWILIGIVAVFSQVSLAVTMYTNYGCCVPGSSSGRPLSNVGTLGRLRRAFDCA